MSVVPLQVIRKCSGWQTCRNSRVLSTAFSAEPTRSVGLQEVPIRLHGGSQGLSRIGEDLHDPKRIIKMKPHPVLGARKIEAGEVHNSTLALPRMLRIPARLAFRGKCRTVLRRPGGRALPIPKDGRRCCGATQYCQQRRRRQPRLQRPRGLFGGTGTRPPGRAGKPCRTGPR